MARIKHNEVERSDFRERLDKIYYSIPADFANRVLKIIPEAKTSRIDNVRYGKTIDFDILAILEDMVSTESKKEIV